MPSRRHHRHARAQRRLHPCGQDSRSGAYPRFEPFDRWRPVRLTRVRDETGRAHEFVRTPGFVNAECGSGKVVRERGVQFGRSGSRTRSAVRPKWFDGSRPQDLAWLGSARGSVGRVRVATPGVGRSERIGWSNADRGVSFGSVRGSVDRIREGTVRSVPSEYFGRRVQTVVRFVQSESVRSSVGRCSVPSECSGRRGRDWFGGSACFGGVRVVSRSASARFRSMGRLSGRSTAVWRLRATSTERDDESHRTIQNRMLGGFPSTDLGVDRVRGPERSVAPGVGQGWTGRRTVWPTDVGALTREMRGALVAFRSRTRRESRGRRVPAGGRRPRRRPSRTGGSRRTSRSAPGTLARP